MGTMSTLTHKILYQLHYFLYIIGYYTMGHRDILCNFGIGLCDIDRILKPFFIIPHKLSARSFLFPWEWLFHPFPDGFSGLICNVDNQGTICFGVFF
mgnify:CR=1 FL=1